MSTKTRIFMVLGLAATIGGIIHFSNRAAVARRCHAQGLEAVIINGKGICVDPAWQRNAP